MSFKKFLQNLLSFKIPEQQPENVFKPYTIHPDIKGVHLRNIKTGKLTSVEEALKESAKKLMAESINTRPIVSDEEIKQFVGLEEWPTASWDGGEPPGKRFVEEALKSDWGIREMPIIANFDGKEIAEATNRAIVAAGGSLKEIEQEIHNRTMEDQPAIMFKAGSDRQNELEIDRANGIIKALRIRSIKKGKANKKLTEENDRLKRDIKENEELEQENARLVDQLKEMAAEYDTEIERLAGEVEKGNEYREGQKGTIMELHEQIRQTKFQEETAREEMERMGRDLQRANGILDLLLRSYGITGADPARF